MYSPIADRRHAGQMLSDVLENYQDQADLIVLGLPRGGIPVAFEVAQTLHAPLDLMLVRKLGTPHFPELAMGAIAMGNIRVLNPRVIRSYSISDEQIAEVEAQERKELERRAATYRGERAYPVLKGKTVILVDDGLATGATMHAAIDAVKNQHPKAIVVAVPVAPPESVAQLRHQVDEVACPLQPTELSSIGQWYQDFSQVTDDEVTAILSEAWHLHKEQDYDEKFRSIR